MKIDRLFVEFVNSEKSGGIALIVVTAISLALANSPMGSGYIDFWHVQLFGHSFAHWINDGLMAIFFLLIGLELEREFYVGELSDMKKSALPIVAALGGMIVPAGLYLSLNWGSTAQSGAGIPMATDIAFAIGVLSILGSRVPFSLKVFLTALAVIDDLGAIVIIAIFYTKSLSIAYLAISLGIWILLICLNRIGIRRLPIYLILGLGMWYSMLLSGVHSTISGVLLAFAIPFAGGGDASPSHKLQHFLHKPVAYIILPLFAAANTAIVLNGSVFAGIFETSSLGIALGLLAGKPLGIFLFSFLGVRAGLCNLPEGINLKSILGVGFLGGIGFTMSIFITMLAFNNQSLVDVSKLAILISSTIAGTLGYLWLSYATNK